MSIEDDDNQFDVAIIGMAGRFPDASNISEFWDNLLAGKVSNTSFSKEELLAAGVPENQVSDPDYVRLAPVLENAEYFDAAFFGYSPQEAKLMDPQQRQLLEVAWSALENAGYDPSRSDNRIATFAGTAMNTYLLHTGLAEHFFQDYLPTLLAGDKDYLATRIAYKLGLTGPAVTVQSACSTSLVAAHIACQSLLNQECDMALVGAAAVRAPLKVGHMYQEGSVFSSDGICRPFDNAANGTVFGSGVGMLVLKRMSDAINDNDNICAVIKGTAINNDGESKSDFTAPSVTRQAEAVIDSYAAAGITADTISYVEAHGTGTYLGDPIEIEALSRAFRLDTKSVGFCGIGSVKSNIGHMDAAAGVASVIKVANAMQHNVIPATANFKSHNAHIDFESSPFYVVDKPTEWKQSSEQNPIRASVNSLGMGGTNGHIVLEEAPVRGPSVLPTDQSPILFPVSAKSDVSLGKNIENIETYFQKNPDVNFSDVSFTLKYGRKQFKKRKVIVAKSSEQLQNFKIDGSSAILAAAGNADIEKPVVFMFPGQGSQFVGMGKELYAREPVFREYIDKARELLGPQLGQSVYESITGNNSDRELNENLKQTSLTQPVLYIVEFAYAKLFQSWGVNPVAMIGHSIGEYVAAALAGVFSFENGLNIVIERGRIMQAAQPGAMLAVPLPQSEVRHLAGDSLDIGVINSDEACVVSGGFEEIDAFSELLKSKSVDTQQLKTSHAFHSRLMESAAAEFETSLSAYTLSKPEQPFISNVTGDWITSELATNSSYWASQLRNTVRFSDGLKTLYKSGPAAFLECGPSLTLSQLVNNDANSGEHHVGVASSRHPKTDTCDQLAAYAGFAKLWTAGVHVDLDQEKPTVGQRIPLPTYHFDSKPFWFEAKPKTQSSANLPGAQREPAIDNWFWSESWTHSADLVSKNDDSPLTLLIDSSARFSEQQLELISAQTNGSLEKIQLESLSNYATAVNPDDRIRLVYVVGKITHLYESAALVELLEFVKLSEQVFTCEVDIAFVTFSSSSVLDYEIDQNACLGVSALSKVANNEFDNINVKVFDLPSEIENSIIERFFLRLNNASDNAVVEAYREGRWWIQSYSRISLPDSANGSSLAAKCHVLVGGFGGVGKVLAKHLSDITETLVITGTSCPEWDSGSTDGSQSSETVFSKQEDIDFVNDLSRNGCRVITRTVDVLNKNNIDILFNELLISQLEPKYIFNLAGKSNDALLSLKNMDEALSVIEPKVSGTINLADSSEVFSQSKVVLFSSTAAWLGVVGQSDYAAANEFQLSIPNSANYQHKVICIAWPGWDGVGMFGRMSESAERDSAALNAVSSEDAFEILQRTLTGSAIRSVVVSPVSIHALQENQSLTNRLSSPSAIAHDETSELHKTLTIPEKIKSVWEDALGVSALNSSDNFFALGGNSLMITQLVSKLRKMYNISISLSEATAKPILNDWISLAEAAGSSSNVESEELIPTTVVETSDAFPLAPSVRRFLDRRSGTGSSKWNLSVMLLCSGKVDENALQETVTVLQQHHRMLRANVDLKSSPPVMTIKPLKESNPLVSIDLTQENADDLSGKIEQIASQYQDSIELASGYLFRIVHLKCPDNVDDRVLLLTHHFNSDGLSWTITLQDFQNVYRSAVLGNEIKLPTKTFDYGNWVNALSSPTYLEKFDIEAWSEMPWHDYVPVPIDNSAESINNNSSAKFVSVRMNKKDSAALISSEGGSFTAAEAGLVCLIRALGTWSNNDLVLVDVLGSGRDLNDDMDVSRTVGFYNSYSTVLCNSNAQQSNRVVFPLLISSIRDQLAKGNEHDILRYMSNDKNIKELMHEIPQAEVLFNFIGNLKNSNDAVLDSEYFSIAKEGYGETHTPDGLRDHKLAVRFEIVDECVDISIVYSENLHNESTIKRVLDLLVYELTEFDSYFYSEVSS